MPDLRPLLTMCLCAWTMIIGLVTVVVLIARHG